MGLVPLGWIIISELTSSSYLQRVKTLKALVSSGRNLLFIGKTSTPGGNCFTWRTEEFRDRFFTQN